MHVMTAQNLSLPERLRVLADVAHAGATEVEHQREVIAEQARTIERLRARLGECQRGRKGEE